MKTFLFLLCHEHFFRVAFSSASNSLMLKPLSIIISSPSSTNLKTLSSSVISLIRNSFETKQKFPDGEIASKRVNVWAMDDLDFCKKHIVRSVIKVRVLGYCFSKDDDGIYTYICTCIRDGDHQKIRIHLTFQVIHDINIWETLL